jgi:hypothetical protein
VIQVEEQDNKLYLRYARSLELALSVLASQHAVNFKNLAELSRYLECDDTRTGLQVLQQLCKRYFLRYEFSDDGLFILNANIEKH